MVICARSPLCNVWRLQKMRDFGNAWQRIEPFYRRGTANCYRRLPRGQVKLPTATWHTSFSGVLRGALARELTGEKYSDDDRERRSPRPAVVHPAVWCSLNMRFYRFCPATCGKRMQTACPWGWWKSLSVAKRSTIHARIKMLFKRRWRH